MACGSVEEQTGMSKTERLEIISDGLTAAIGLHDVTISKSVSRIRIEQR